MRLQERARRIALKLEELYPNPAVPLIYSNPFTLLIAVLLSAQTTDKKVNEVTPRLFKKASTALEMSRLPEAEIRDLIRQVGLAPTKARNIAGLSKKLVEEFEGEVPRTFEALESLPGVGHKTASVVLVQAFQIPAFPVDTHIQRLAGRWGLSSGKNVVQIENDLKALFPEASWGRLHLQIILFGREYCKARYHDSSSCPICSWAAASDAP